MSIATLRMICAESDILRHLINRENRHHRGVAIIVACASQKEIDQCGTAGLNICSGIIVIEGKVVYLAGISGGNVITVDVYASIVEARHDADMVGHNSS